MARLQMLPSEGKVNDLELLKQAQENFIYSNGNLLWAKKSAERIKIGDIAGAKTTKGYVKVIVNGKFYRAHRIIFLIHYGYLPKLIDHIDGNPSNNKIENLREATNSQNQHNRKINANNVSKTKGISWEKSTKQWRVDLGVNGKRKHFGRFFDLELAELVSTEARNKYHKQFARMQ